MGFAMTPSLEATHNLRLRLSELAREVIGHDQQAFGFGHSERIGAGLINDILENFLYDAEASISRTLNRRECDLEETLKSIIRNTEERRRIKQALLEREKLFLKKNMRCPEAGSGPVIRLRNAVIDMLKADECEENLFYKKPTDYIQAVLEEYARLPYEARERICFATRLKAIEVAIQNKHPLHLQTEGGAHYFAIPHSVQSDPFDTTNYLVCFSRKYHDKLGDLQPGCFRISRLVSIVPETSKTASLSSLQTTVLGNKLKKRGVQFLSFEEDDIIVKLTSDGVRKYDHIRQLRPRYIRRDEDVYTFRCTLFQAEFYFFKFGADAEILKPDSLRAHFAEMYQQASDVYHVVTDIPESKEEN